MFYTLMLNSFFNAKICKIELQLVYISTHFFYSVRSPNLNPCDFYLLGHHKSSVKNPLSIKLDDLKENIEKEIQNG